MTLGQLQRAFATDYLPLLLNYIDLCGYEVSLGDAYRDPRIHGKYGEKKSYSASQSNHKVRLAIDLNLFKNGRYLTQTKDHAKFGKFWLSLSEANPEIQTSWGGQSMDGNHYSILYRGRW